MVNAIHPLRHVAARLMCWLCLIFCVPVFAEAPRLISITAPIQQGSLIQGQVTPGTSLRLGDDPIFVDPKGKFVLGVGRDHGETLTLTLGANGQQRQETLMVGQREYDIQRIEGVASKYVSPSDEVLSRIKSDNQSVKATRQIMSLQPFFMDGFILPAKGRISGVYGSQRVFNGVPKRPHFGLDVAAPTGTPVVAPANGVVRLVNADMYYSGGTLIVDHGWGVSSTFIHLSKVDVKEGQTVVQGQKMGEIGATGRVTGPHLDWRINWFQTRLDPALVLPDFELPKK